jgi:DNA-binding transcriptional LysR family regulator
VVRRLCEEQGCSLRWCEPQSAQSRENASARYPSAALEAVFTVLAEERSLPERLLSQLGVKRHCVISVPYFTVALRMVAHTPLVLSVPRRLADSTIDRQQVKILKPPSEFQSFRYLMAWHPRHDSDAQNQWLRQLVRDATSSIPA